MLGQLVAQLHQQFLHGLDVCADHTLLEQSGTERDAGIGCGRLIRVVIVIDERQLVLASEIPMKHIELHDI